METRTYLIADNGQFPNSRLPVIHHIKALKLPMLFKARAIEKTFEQNGWTNNWDAGIYTYNHYHSNTHEAMGIYAGRTVVLLGGENGKTIFIQAGDVLIIPAGVAHKNLGKEKDVHCVGGYPEGKDFDMNYGLPGERPQTDKNIQELDIPDADPLLGREGGLIDLWNAQNFLKAQSAGQPNLHHQYKP
jgi:uncharacterized protein YjlB